MYVLGGLAGTVSCKGSLSLSDQIISQHAAHTSWFTSASSLTGCCRQSRLDQKQRRRSRRRRQLWHDPPGPTPSPAAGAQVMPSRPSLTLTTSHRHMQHLLHHKQQTQMQRSRPPSQVSKVSPKLPVHSRPMVHTPQLPPPETRRSAWCSGPLTERRATMKHTKQRINSKMAMTWLEALLHSVVLCACKLHLLIQ